MDLLARNAINRAQAALRIAMDDEAPKPATHIGLSPKEVREYSLLRALAAKVKNPGATLPGLEGEAHRTLCEKIGREPTSLGNFYVPHEVQTRDLTAASGGGGGYLIDTRQPAGSFVDALRAASRVMQLGATLLPGLTSNVVLPKQSTTSTTGWLSGEASQATESQASYVQVSLTPKTVAAFSEVSRQLILQTSPAADGVVLRGLGSDVATAVDLAALSGSGASGQPTGITNAASIGAFTGASLSLAALSDAQLDILNANVPGEALGYLTTPTIAVLLKARQRASGTSTFLWEGSVRNGLVEGLPAWSTNQMAAATMLCGDWSQLVIGEWGILEIETDPFTKFSSALVGVRAIWTVDIAVRYPQAFSLASSIS